MVIWRVSRGTRGVARGSRGVGNDPQCVGRGTGGADVAGVRIGEHNLT